MPKEAAKNHTLSGKDLAAIGAVCQQVNNYVRKYYRQEESKVPIPAQVVKAVLESRSFCPRKSHAAWRAARLKAGWKAGAYNQKKKRHPNLKAAGWDDLPFKERVKDWTFYASLMGAAIAIQFKYDEAAQKNIKHKIKNLFK